MGKRARNRAGVNREKQRTYGHALRQYMEEGARLAEERQHQNQCRLHATLGFCSRCLEDK